MEMKATAAVDESKLNEFMHKAVFDIGAAMSAALVLIGDKLGLYRALAAAGPQTPEGLAEITDTHERYIREWLANQAAGGYVTYDPKSGRYAIPPEQALALADDKSTVFLPGAFQIVAAAFAAAPRIQEAFQSGEGLDWCDHHAHLYEGTERFFRPNYAGHLVSSWIPSLEGMEEKLGRGARVADVGCGHGSSTILMAQAYPKSQIVGFDYHHLSIEAARRRAAEAGVGDRVQFHVGESTDFPGQDFDLVCNFDSLHDMGDPAGAARHVREILAKDGTWMIVEPYAGDRVEDNLNPIGRVYYAASTMICVPASLAHDGPALGAQAGESRMRDLVIGAGFRRFRRASETPFNIVYEAKP